VVTALAALRVAIDEHSQMPQELASEISTAAEAIGGGSWAVRSSFGREDSKGASWAGQFETLLGVDTLHLPDAIRKCWASAFEWSPFAYGDMQGDVPTWPALAVLVQELVNSEKSGVAFVQESGDVVIEACLGLGSPLVKGEINPDRYIITSSYEVAS